MYPTKVTPEQHAMIEHLAQHNLSKRNARTSVHALLSEKALGADPFPYL